jgi:hypothetical protein
MCGVSPSWEEHCSQLGGHDDFAEGLHSGAGRCTGAGGVYNGLGVTSQASEWTVIKMSVNY